MSAVMWVLLDGRAWIDEDDAAVLYTGTREECEREQRLGTYGDDCRVVEWHYTPLDAPAAGGGKS